MPKRSFLNSIRVESPCSESWEEMSGNERVRFCSHCSKNVNNISEMTPTEAVRLVRRSGGRLCVRYRTDPKTNAPVFAERIAKFARHGAAAGVLGASLLAAGGTFAQERVENVQLVQIERAEHTGGATGKVTGYVTDPNGAAIPYALVTLTNQETMMSHVQNATDAGYYEFKDLDAGKYKLRFEAGGFAAKETSDVFLTETGEARRDGQLNLLGVSASVEVETNPDVEHYVTVGSIGIGYARPLNPLVNAVYDEDLEEVKARIIMGAKINVRDKGRDGMSPLHAAIEMGNVEIAEYLLVHGAKTNIRDSFKRTPVMLLDDDDENASELLGLLIRFGAKLTLADKEKNTVLHHLAESLDNASLVKEMIAHGANANAVNKEGKTALMIAVEEANLDTVEALLQSGVDANIRDRSGKTALDYAASELTRSILQTYGAVGGVPQ